MIYLQISISAALAMIAKSIIVFRVKSGVLHEVSRRA